VNVEVMETCGNSVEVAGRQGFFGKLQQIRWIPRIFSISGSISKP
jgi:hypothetical protein